ncbi:hypothetical protein AB0F81_21070 [Actinoplanes sp. NPDC024001]|uniref:hypothetical protein n=1 Tax=Actinoplanes sp. NPDC024001 TaxID=3154598 RepID=UPI0033DE257D
MRTVVFAAAGLSALLLAGCSADQPEAAPAPASVPSATADATVPEGGVTPGSSAAATQAPAGDAAAGDAALAGNSEAICAQATRTSNNFGTTFAADYQLLIEASGKDAQAKSQAEQKVKRDVENFSFALLDMSKLASEPQLKKALATMGAKVTALKGDLDRIDDKRLAALQATLDKACGRG